MGVHQEILRLIYISSPGEKIEQSEAMQDDNWTKGLWRMQTADEMAETIILENRLMEVQLNDQHDEIIWLWMADGRYTARSAYRAQFVGSFCTFVSTTLWKPKVEGKHRFLLGY